LRAINVPATMPRSLFPAFLLAVAFSTSQSFAQAPGAPQGLLYNTLPVCRLVDSRGYGAPVQGGLFQANERRTISPGGQCGIPSAGVKALLVSFTTQNLTPSSGGYLAMLPPGAQVTGIVDVFNLGSQWSASSSVVNSLADGSFDIFVSTAAADVIVDVMGYFSVPPTLQSVPVWIDANGKAVGRAVGPFAVAAKIADDDLIVSLYGSDTGGAQWAQSSTPVWIVYSQSNCQGTPYIQGNSLGSPKATYVYRTPENEPFILIGQERTTLLVRSRGDYPSGYCTDYGAAFGPFAVWTVGTPVPLTPVGREPFTLR
jgi:hypothetical protein